MAEYSQECLAIEVRRRLTSQSIQEVFGALFPQHGCPQYIRSDKGPEFIGQALRKWYQQLGIALLFLEPGSPWEHGHEPGVGQFQRLAVIDAGLDWQMKKLLIYDLEFL